MTATLDRRADYVSAVAVELADLPAEERGELVEELDDHVAALLEDRPDVDLVTELGTPRAYAAELRAAAGLTRAREATPSLADRVRAVPARVAVALPWLPPFLRLLRPAWWVLRGAVVALVLGIVVLGFSWRSGQGLVLLALGVIGSSWLAQAARPSRARRLITIGLDVVGVLALLWLFVAHSASGATNTVYDTQYVPNCPIELDNLYAYDASGQALDDVRLYDQYGTPFDLSTFGCNVGGQFAPGSAGVNAYPWPTAGTEVFGGAPTGPPATLTPLPGATVASSPAGTPSATGTPSLTGTP